MRYDIHSEIEFSGYWRISEDIYEMLEQTNKFKYMVRIRNVRK